MFVLKDDIVDLIVVLLSSFAWNLHLKLTSVVCNHEQVRYARSWAVFSI